LNTELSIYAADEPSDFFPLPILVKEEDLGWLSLFSLWNIDSLEAFSFPIPLNTKGHYCDIDSCNLLNIDALELDVAWLPLSSSSSSIVMLYE